MARDSLIGPCSVSRHGIFPSGLSPKYSWLWEGGTSASSKSSSFSRSGAYDVAVVADAETMQPLPPLWPKEAYAGAKARELALILVFYLEPIARRYMVCSSARKWQRL